ncbi:MAG: S41 family peptidase, partial [Bacteroidota bacterium]
MFAEAWKLIDDNFYDPKFHGNDWDQLKEKYQRLAYRASTNRDFRDIFNDMLGELNASHMGLYGSDRAETQRESTGRLGIEVAVQKDGAKVLHVVPNTPADKSKSKIEEGDLITRVNGEAVTTGQNFYSLLTNTNNNRVLVNVKGKDGKEREVVIRPSSSINRQLYEEWVQERKRLTEEYSGGRLGYIHIQGMNWPSFERFERELTASGQGKDGIVIDVRYNGGGWTTDFLMSVLTVQQHAYTIPRGATDDLDKNHLAYKSNYPFGERLPWSSWTRPSIALCNTTSYSNAEIFSHAYKNLDIGTLVGEPTFGAVISTGGARLIDGSLIRQPFRAWYVKATEENMENGPAVPDIILSNAPDSKSKGQDEQLKRAVDELINQIDRQARK